MNLSEVWGFPTYFDIVIYTGLVPGEYIPPGVGNNSAEGKKEEKKITGRKIKNK